MSTHVDAPPPRNYGQETRDTLQAQIDLAPSLLKAEQSTRPGYTALELATLNNALNGVDGAPGLLEQYQSLAPALSKLEQDNISSQRQSDIQAVQDLGPKATQALRLSNPGAYTLLDMLTQQAHEDVAAGTGLTPSESRQVSQSVRAGQSARGLAMGPAEAYQEALATDQFGLQRQGQRRDNAFRVLGLNQSMTADPFLAILGRPSNTFGQAQSLTGQGGGISNSLGPQLFNPESQYAGDIFNTNYQGALAANTASASNRAGLFGGLLSLGGSLGAAGIKTFWGK